MLSQAPARCANISDALDVPITDPSPRTNNAPSTINTRQLPQYACALALLGLAFSKTRGVLEGNETSHAGDRDATNTGAHMCEHTNCFFPTFANPNRYRNICEIASQRSDLCVDADTYTHTHDGAVIIMLSKVIM